MNCEETLNITATNVSSIRSTTDVTYGQVLSILGIVSILTNVDLDPLTTLVNDGNSTLEEFKTLYESDNANLLSDIRNIKSSVYNSTDGTKTVLDYLNDNYISTEKILSDITILSDISIGNDNIMNRILSLENSLASLFLKLSVVSNSNSSLELKIDKLLAFIGTE